MKKVLLLLCIALATSCDTLQQLGSMTPGGSSEVAAGLREALRIGTQNSTNRLSAVDGFFKNAMVKIIMPEEAKKAENVLRSMGFSSVVDKAILSMNRAAEEASKFAADIFINAIQQMTISDAIGILRGGTYAATNYFKEKTTLALTDKFRPVVSNALATVEATKYWNDVFTIYNRFSREKVDTDLTAYVTRKAIDGLFYYVAQEEKNIRENPAARVTNLLKKVFGNPNSYIQPTAG